MKLVDILKAFMFERGFTIMELSKKSHVTSIPDILRGDHYPSDKSFTQICKALKVHELVVRRLECYEDKEMIDQLLKKCTPNHFHVSNLDFFDIPGFSKYQISKSGQVRNKETKYIIKYCIDRNIYKRAIRLIDDLNKKKSPVLYRLLAKTFVPNPKNKRCVIFKDNDESNLDIDNLAWATKSERMYHINDIRAGERLRQSKLNDEKVREIRILHSKGFGFEDIGKMYGVTQNPIRCIINGTTWKHVK